MPHLNSRGPEPSRDIIKALSEVHHDIRELIQGLGLDTEKLRAYVANSEMLSLPWTNSPSKRSQEALLILGEPVSHKLSIADAENELMARSSTGDTTCPGLLGAMLALRNREWSAEGKVAFSRIIATEPVGALDQALFFAKSEEEVRSICEVATCWIVFNALAETALSKCTLPGGSSEVIDAIQQYSLNSLAANYFMHLQEGTLIDGHPGANLEGVLHTLAVARPEVGSVVKRLLAQWEAALSAEGVGADLTLAERLESTIKGSPLDHLTREADGERLAQLARAYQHNVEKNLALVSYFRPLVERPEWSSPLNALAQMGALALVRISFHGATPWSHRKLVDLFRTTVSHMETKPHLVISSQELQLASNESAPVGDIVEGINTYIKTGQKSFAEVGTVTPERFKKLQVVLAFVNEMAEIFGPEHLHLVVHNNLDEYLSRNTLSGFLLASDAGSGDDLLNVSVKLSASTDLDHDYLTRVRERLERFLDDLPFMAAPEVVLLAQEIVPFLAQTRGGADPLGFVGFSPLAALEVANSSFLADNKLVFTSPQNPHALRITLVEDFNEESERGPLGIARRDCLLSD